MNNEFNQIRDAYLKNMFAPEDQKVNVREMIAQLADKAITGDQDENLYHLAARFADEEAVILLREAGLKPNTDKCGNTPLHALVNTKFEYADKNIEAKADHIYKTATELIAAGVNPKKKNDSGNLPYAEAAKLLYIYPFIQAMADANVRMDVTDSANKNLLHLIAESIYHRQSIPGAVDAAYKTLKILLEKGGIDPEDKDVYNATPLIYAQRSGIKNIAALLSGNEEDTVIAGMNMHQAVLNRDEEALKALVASGADVNELSDEYRKTPLMLACEYPSPNLVKVLAEGGADVNYRTGSGETATFYLLTKAISNLGRGMVGGQEPKVLIEILKTLIKNGLNLDAPADAEDNTPLNIVCQLGYMANLNYNLAEELIEAGCDINKANRDGRTPLMSFAAKGNETQYGIAELLIDNEADVTYADKTGSTALMYAAGNIDKMSAKRIASLILDSNDAGTDRVNNAGLTAMDIAVNAENEAVVKLLLTYSE